MPRPTISDDTLDRLETIAETRSRLPASHLTTQQKVSFLLDELEAADKRANNLSNRVGQLEAEIEELRNTNQGDTGLNPTGSGFNR